MSTYEYIIEVNDKASNFIHQFTKTLDKVNERFGSSRIRGTEAFENMSAPVEKVNQALGDMGGGLDKVVNFGTQGDLAVQSTASLNENFSALQKGLSGSSEAVDIAKERFGEIGASVANMPIGDALTSVFSGATDSLQGVLPETMNQQWDVLREGLEQRLIPAINTFSEVTGINLDHLSPKIAGLAQQFSNFLGENGEAIQGFIGKTQNLLNFFSSAKNMASQLSGTWKRAKSALNSLNITSKMGTVTMNAKTIATRIHSAVTTKLAGATKIMTAAQRVLNTTLKANPIVFIIGLVVAAGAAFLAFGKKVSLANNEMERFNRLKEETDERINKGKELEERFEGLQFMNSRQKGNLFSDFNTEINALEDTILKRQAAQSKFDHVEKQKSLDYYRSQVGQGRTESAHRNFMRLSKELSEFKEFQAETGRLMGNLDQLRGRAGAVKDSYMASQMAGEAGDGLPELQQGSADIAGGGKKSTNINISLEKMIETLEVHADTLDESLSEVETKVKEVFLRILNSGNYAAQ